MKSALRRTAGRTELPANNNILHEQLGKKLPSRSAPGSTGFGDQALVSNAIAKLSDNFTAANEVHELAELTVKTISDISKVVAAIQVETDRIKMQMEGWMTKSWVSTCRDVPVVMDNIKHLLELSCQMEGTIFAAELCSFIEVVKVDHILHKLEIYKVFLGMSDRNIDSFASHTDCRLGKWYSEGECRNYSCGMDVYAAVDSPHRAFHLHGNEAVTAFRAGDLLRGVGLIGQMEADIIELFAALEKITVARSSGSDSSRSPSLNCFEESQQ